MTSVSDTKQVQDLADKFDLEINEGYRIVVTEWEFSKGRTNELNCITIHSADVYDSNNNFIKTADLNKLQHSIHEYTVIFKKKP